MNFSTENKYAVVGAGGLFPGALNLDQFWENLLEKRVFIEKVPENSVERDVFFRPEVLGKTDKADRSYTDLLAPIRSVDFDARKFRIPPAVAAHMDTNQKVGLLAAEQAMALGGLEGVDRERVSVFMGSSMIGQVHHHNVSRFECDKFEYYLKRHPLFSERLSVDEQARVVGEVRHRLIERTAQVTEDTAPGVLPNIIAARICSVFDLHGHAYVIDAACASGLAAIICGIQQLRLGECDAVICGAADILNAEIGRIYFSGIGALSGEGSFPFDERASGFIPGDGGGVVILQRLEDAIRSGRRILSVVAGYGQASDGRGKAIAAPNELWQARTIQRAWEMAGVCADTIELIEAHGTATQVGDLSEVNALKRSFKDLQATRVGHCGIGSVKSNIGHLKSAAGIAGFLKAVLALDKKVLPPTAGFSKENPKLGLKGSPFYVLDQAKEWAETRHPRRAGVSAFGFGGADYHIALEEYRASDYACPNSRTSIPSSPVATAKGTESSASVAQHDSRAELDTWLEPVFFSADSPSEMLEQLERFSVNLSQQSDNRCALSTVQTSEARPSAPLRLAMALSTVHQFRSQVSAVAEWLGKPGAAAALQAKGIAIGTGAPLTMAQVAVMFPGQGSQYPDMLLRLFERYPSARSYIDRADLLWQKRSAMGVTELIRSEVRGAEATEQLLRQTQHTHPALVFTSLAAYRVLEEMGLAPAVLIGHSVGEFTALAAAQRLTFADAVDLVYARATAFSEVPEGDKGAMAALPLSSEDARLLLQEVRSSLSVANVNSRIQTIVSGSEADVVALLAVCSARSIHAIRLNVSHAFHSPLMAPAESRFLETLSKTRFREGCTRVIANGSNRYYGAQSHDVQQELANQITGSVRFAESIQRLYEDGIRLFVEVGPGSVLASLAKNILAGTDSVVLASDNKRGDGVEAFVRLVCSLFAAGIELDPTRCVTRGAPQPASCTWGSQTKSQLPTSVDAPPGTPNEARYKSPSVVNPGEVLTLIPPASEDVPTVVYSGVAIGLPGSFKASFRDDNFEQLFDGNNLIERLSDDERRSLVNLNISKVVKSEQGASFANLASLDEVIQLAGKVGRLDLASDYRIDVKDVANMSSAIAHAVAAGYEALRDAQIPLVHEYTRTSGGSMLPERWALPKEMQRHTGVIFATGFPLLDPMIREVSRHLAHRYGHKLREELFEFYDSLLQHVSDRDSRKVLSDWYALNCTRLRAVPNSDDVYSFNHHLMTQLAMQANNRLARLINARGPNFQINAACSSIATAVTLAEDLIRSGRAKRMIVIGGDDPTSTESLPYLGAGFLATGACTNSGDLYEAALPFDRRRNGMIMGAGAVAIVVELESECEHRAVVPLCELMGTHAFNTAGHSSQLDVPRYAEELDNFISRMEVRHRIPRQKIAEQLVYVSHETYTPPRGGCSESEAVALRHVFGASLPNIEISNTKGMTGHTMGASIEDAVAAKALQFGRAAPVVNFKHFDPALEGLKLSRGEPGDFAYALRMAAGFGSQGNYLLLKRRAQSEERIFDKSRHANWLRTISQLDKPELTQLGRVLVVKDAKPGSIVVDRPNIDTYRPGPGDSVRVPPNRVPSFSSIPSSVAASSHPSNAKAVATAGGLNVQALVFSAVAEVTGYPTTILELDMDLEADLGVDTVKQATILARLAEELGLGELGSVSLSECPTLRSIVELYQDKGGSRQSAPPPPAKGFERATESQGHATSDVTHQVQTRVFETIAKVTGYSADILDANMELEADLGIDTVKQATVLSLLAEQFGLSPEAGLRMSEFSTVGQLVVNFSEISKQTQCDETRADVPPKKLAQTAGNRNTSSVASQATSTSVSVEAPRVSSPEIMLDRVYAAIQEVTPYPQEMLDAELRIATDLELSAESCELLRSTLASRFPLPVGWAMPNNCSIGELAAELAHYCRATPPSVSEHDRREAEPSPVLQGRQWLGRQVLAIREAPSSNSQSLSLDKKVVWIIGDDATRVRWAAGKLKALGSSVSELVMPASGAIEELSSELERLIAAQRPAIILDVTGALGDTDLRELSPELVVPAITRAADCRFAVIKRLEQAECRPIRMLLVVELGGQFALDARTSPLNALHGIALGFYKAVRKEWREHTYLTALDIPTAAWADGGGEAWELIEGELRGSGDGVEICYVDRRRHRVVAVDTAMSNPVQLDSLGADEVIVATGGGSGITSKIVLEIAKHQKSRFALVGRTQLDPAAKGKQFTNEAQRAAEKLAIQQRLASRGVSVTPRLIESEFARTERSAEILATLGELERLGSAVRYVQADVCDREAMQEALRETRERFGPITMLILGAGVDVSHKISQKSVEEFHRVHAPKTIGTYLIRWLCRDEPLRHVVAISSISGRFGNLGQVDYSAGNAFMDLMVRTEPNGGPRCISLSWSGWSEVGMAWRNSYVRGHAESIGLNFIEPQAGAKAALVELLSSRSPSEVVIHRGLGGVADADQLEASLEPFPLLDWVERSQGSVIRAHRRFSIQRDVLLDQHRFAGVPLMPGVGFMEMMAEIAALVRGDATGTIIWDNLAFLDAFKLYREEARDVCVELDSSRSAQGLPMVLYSPFLSKTGPSEKRKYAQATVRLTHERPAPPFEPSLTLPWATETDFRPELERAKEGKQNVLFGPAFNEACNPNAQHRSRVRWGRDGIETVVPLPSACLDDPRYPLKQYLVNPAFLDSLHQAGAVLAIELTGHVYLPVAAERFAVYTPIREPGSYRVVAKLKHLDDESAVYDMIMVRPDGELCAAISNSSFRRIHA